MHKIVSLIPSSTEIVCALGFTKQIVGRSHECDYPKSIVKVPICTSSNLDCNATSLEIDKKVKDILKNSLSIYLIDSKLLKSLDPTVIVTQAQCEVCAVSLKDVEKTVQEWIGSETKIVSLQPNCVQDIYSDIVKVAKALDVENTGITLVDNLQQRVDAIKSKACGIEYKPKVACIEWIEPLMAAGNWVPQLVKMAGAINLFGEMGKHSPWMKWEELSKEDPDIIVIMSCGFDIARSKAEMQTLVKKAEWKNLAAVKENKVFITDGNQFFNRPGPRVVESLEILAEIFHPQHFDFGHRQKGWSLFDIF